MTDKIIEYWTEKFEFKEAYGAAKWTTNDNLTYMILVVKRPNDTPELIINSKDFETKFQYVMNAYDDNLCLKANPSIRILTYMFV